MSGLDFQLCAYLADFTASLASGDAVLDAGGRFANGLEALSDHTRARQDDLVLVQANSGLRTESAAAAVEFAHIDRFFEQEKLLELRSRARYEIVRSYSARLLDSTDIELPRGFDAKIWLSTSAICSFARRGAFFPAASRLTLGRGS